MNMPSWLPLLVVLACPLMMIFMMRGMRRHRAAGSRRETEIVSRLPMATERCQG